MSAEVRDCGSDSTAWAECSHCGWSRPASGFVHWDTARRYADEHNSETNHEATS